MQVQGHRGWEHLYTGDHHGCAHTQRRKPVLAAMASVRKRSFRVYIHSRLSQVLKTLRCIDYSKNKPALPALSLRVTANRSYYCCPGGGSWQGSHLSPRDPGGIRTCTDTAVSPLHLTVPARAACYTRFQNTYTSQGTARQDTELFPEYSPSYQKLCISR